MRIGLITPGFCASEDDWCVPALTDLARVLAERDEVTVFALRYPHRRRLYGVHGATVHPTGGAQRGGLARLPILVRTLARVLRDARRRPFDVLWAWWAHEPGFVAAVAGRLTRTPVLVSILGGELVDLADVDYGGGRSRVNRWLAARALESAAAVTVGSNLLEELADGRVPPDKLSRQPLGVDLGRFTPSPQGRAVGPASTEHGTPSGLRLDGDPRILQVASLSPVKDQRTLFAAFEIVVRRHAGARLHLVGEGELDPGLVERVRQPGLAGRVVLHGAVDHGQLASIYRQADLLVQSSRFEAQGMAVLEAVACGCPAVGTAAGVLPELGEAVAGAVTAPGDPAALAEVIIAHLDDPARRRRLAEAQGSALPGFALRATAAQWRRRFEVLAARGRDATA